MIRAGWSLPKTKNPAGLSLPKKQDLDFGIPAPHPKDSIGRFVHGGRIYAARQAMCRREHKPWHSENK